MILKVVLKIVYHFGYLDLYIKYNIKGVNKMTRQQQLKEIGEINVSEHMDNFTI